MYIYIIYTHTFFPPRVNSTSLTLLLTLREFYLKYILKLLYIDYRLYTEFTLYSQRFCGGLTPKVLTHSNSAIIAFL